MDKLSNIKLMDGEQSDAVSKFFASVEHNNIFTLSGQAGSGKSFVISQLCAYSDEYNFIYSGSTNKAVSILQKNLDVEAFKMNISEAKNVQTYHKRLGFRPKFTDDGHKLFTPDISSWDKKKREYHNSVLIIDECSMISDSDYDYIIQFSDFTGCKILFVGDDCQLPPMNTTLTPEEYNPDSTCAREKLIETDRLSKSFDADGVVRMKLKNIHRTNDDNIKLTYKIFREFTVLTNICKLISHLNCLKRNHLPNIKFLTDPDTIVKKACNDNNSVILACSNKRVNEFNMKCRKYKFPDSVELYDEGEIIMLTNFYQNHYTCERFVIKSVERVFVELRLHNGKIKNIEVYKIIASPENNIIPPDEKSDEECDSDVSSSDDAPANDLYEMISDELDHAMSYCVSDEDEDIAMSKFQKNIKKQYGKNILIKFLDYWNHKNYQSAVAPQTNIPPHPASDHTSYSPSAVINDDIVLKKIINKKDKRIFNEYLKKERSLILSNHYAKLKTHKKTKQKKWAEYNKFREDMDSPFTYSYSITSYKSQGDCFNSVYIDLVDMVCCRQSNIFQLARELYTSVSRTQNKITFLYPKNNNHLFLKLLKCNRCKKSLPDKYFKKNGKVLMTCEKCKKKNHEYKLNLNTHSS